jgi:hypothetical protein
MLSVLPCTPVMEFSLCHDSQTECLIEFPIG